MYKSFIFVLKKFNSFKIITNVFNKKMSSSIEELVNKMPPKVGSNGKPIEMLRFHNIIKSQQDCREYRGLQLENKMKVLLISDKTTDVSAASMAVQVGFMSDPDNLPGLAHFLEHMLFLGTEKYPDENGYTSYLTQNAGHYDAGTLPDMTKYYFDVNPDKLDAALDRFAQFFIAPLFTKSATDRELNAVNSEHEANLAVDVWRVRQVRKHLADPKHPYNKFGTGNISTLEEIPKKTGINVREELLKFHAKWYSANIMCLAVIGKETLDELEHMVLEKFSKVENKNVNPPIWPKKPFKDEDNGKKIFILPVDDIRTLTMSFMTDDLDKYYKSNPERYISHLIGHEGKGSILSELRTRGWSNELAAGHHNVSRGFGFFEITVDLTEDGFENIDEVVKLIFQYIKLLKEDEPKKWIFDEYCNLRETLFRFKDKEYPSAIVSSVVHSMQVYPLEEVLSAPYLASEWRPDLITNLLNDLVPEKCRIYIIGQKLEPQTTDVEPWYKTKFSQHKIPSNIMKNWINCGLNESLTIPLPNPFIPSEFDLLPEDKNISKHPVIIYDSSIIRIWHKQDMEFLRPKSCIDLDFSSPIAYNDPLNCNLTHMLVSLFRDDLSEYIYDAKLAGLRLVVINTISGISIAVTGYSDKQQILLEKVLNHLFNFKIDSQRFKNLKDEYVRTLRNYKTSQPFIHAIDYLTLILAENKWSKAECLEAMQLVTLEKLQHFIKEFFSRLHIECFLYGNINKQKALEITEIVKKKLEATDSVMLPILSRQLLQRREYKLNDGESYIFEANNYYHKSSCAELYLQCGMQTDKTASFVDLIVQILKEPCFNILRTKEQLGYVVFCDSRKLNGTVGVRIVVQSPKHPTFVENRIEVFLETMLNQLEAMSNEDFQLYKDSLITNKLQKPKRLVSMFQKYLSEISLAEYHFEREEAEVAIIKNITKNELLNFYKNYIANDGSGRRVLSIFVISSVDNPPDDINEVIESEQFLNEKSHDVEKTDNGRLKIVDLSLFKSSKELFPVARPFLNIRPKGARSKL